MAWAFNSDGTMSDYDTGNAANPGDSPWWGASQPSSSDSGWSYGQDVVDILKYGVGVLMQRESQEWEDKRRYEIAANGIALQGQAAAVAARANGLQATAFGGTSGVMPYVLIGGAVLLVVLLLKD